MMWFDSIYWPQVIVENSKFISYPLVVENSPLDRLVDHELDGGVRNEKQRRQSAAPQTSHAFFAGDSRKSVCKQNMHCQLFGKFCKFATFGAIRFRQWAIMESVVILAKKKKKRERERERADLHSRNSVFFSSHWASWLRNSEVGLLSPNDHTN